MLIGSGLVIINLEVGSRQSQYLDDKWKGFIVIIRAFGLIGILFDNPKFIILIKVIPTNLLLLNFMKLNQALFMKLLVCCICSGACLGYFFFGKVISPSLPLSFQWCPVSPHAQQVGGICVQVLSSLGSLYYALLYANIVSCIDHHCVSRGMGDCFYIRDIICTSGIYSSNFWMEIF